jgi:hypothetical protein
MTEKADQGQCCKVNLKQMDVGEETLGATEMQQLHKEPRPKRAITCGKQENTQQDLQADRRAGDHEVNSWVFCQDLKNECQNIVQDQATAQTKKDCTQLKS